MATIRVGWPARQPVPSRLVTGCTAVRSRTRRAPPLLLTHPAPYPSARASAPNLVVMSVPRPVLIALVLAVGVGLGLGLSRLGGGTAPQPAPLAGADESVLAGDDDALAPLPDPPSPIPPDQVEDDPRAVLEAFLAAEAHGEWEASYAFLTATDRDVVFPTPAAWVAAHGDFANVRAWQVEGVRVEGDRAEVVTLTGYEPALDPVLGLIPARARVTWSLVRGPAGWRVASQDSAAQPLYPPADGAEQVAAEWVARRAACEDPGPLEEGLIGSPALAQDLCGASGPVEVGPVAQLSDSDAVTALLSAWGPEVFAWARTVRVDSPARMTAVLGPFGDDWRVVAVLP